MDLFLWLQNGLKLEKVKRSLSNAPKKTRDASEGVKKKIRGRFLRTFRMSLYCTCLTDTSKRIAGQTGTPADTFDDIAHVRTSEGH